MYKRLSSLLLVVAFCLLYQTTNVYAQAGATTSSINGTITDEQKGVIAGATVVARNIDTNTVREALTGENGAYVFVNLQPGRYELKVAVEGFKATTIACELDLGTSVLANFVLPIGAVGDIIEVKARNLVEEGKTESSTNQDANRIANLPINVRDFLEFAITSARVTPDRIPPNGTTSTSGLSFNGQSARLNNITLDGNTNNDTYTGGVRAQISQDAVQEFQVVSDSYSAEFGRAVGGVINIVTKSGTNEFHGSVFNFLRNDSLSARDAFSSFKPEFRQYQSGASLSGPIRKDQAFFFLNFERFSQKQNTIVTIPDALVAAGRRIGYPLANGPVPFGIGTSNVLARADVQVNSKDKLSIRYNGNFAYNGNFETIFGSGGLISPTSSGILRLDDNAGSINNTFFTGNLVNETRFLITKRSQSVEAADPNNAISILGTEIGQIAFGQNVLSPQDRELSVYQIVNIVSISKGRNLIKFGGDFAYTNTPNQGANFPIVGGGFYIYAPLDFAAIIGNPAAPFFNGQQVFDPAQRTPAQKQFLTGFAAFLPTLFPGFPVLPLDELPLPTLFAQSFGDGRQEVNQKLFSAFVQDDIKLTPNFLLKAGVRYDIFREKFIPTNNGNFSPRVALSYTPSFLPKANVRASYGIFFGTGPTLQLAVLSKAYDNRVELPQIVEQFLPFPLTLIPFLMPGHRFPVGNTLPSGIPLFPQLRQTYQTDPNLRNNYSHQATLGLSYLLNNDTKVSVEYNYVRGIKIIGSRFINPVVRQIPGDPVGSILTGRVDPTRGFVFEIESSFDSYYNGLTLSINRRLANKFSVFASYTFSKAQDNFVDFRTDIASENDPLKPGLERALSVQDVRGRFVASGTVDLSTVKNVFARDFQFSILMELSSGRPFNLITGLNSNANTLPGDRPFGIGRNAGRTPGFASVDLRIARNFPIRENISFKFTAEAFNLFNRTNISSVNNVFPPDAQGRISLPPQEDGRFIATPDRFTNSFRPRVFQLGFRFLF